jgi:hypothetical protein
MVGGVAVLLRQQKQEELYFYENMQVIILSRPLRTYIKMWSYRDYGDRSEASILANHWLAL